MNLFSTIVNDSYKKIIYTLLCSAKSASIYDFNSNSTILLSHSVFHISTPVSLVQNGKGLIVNGQVNNNMVAAANRQKQQSSLKKVNCDTLCENIEKQMKAWKSTQDISDAQTKKCKSDCNKAKKQ